MCLYAAQLVVPRTRTKRCRTYRDRNHNIRVSLERLHYLAALEVPEEYLVVLTAGDDPLATRDAEARGDAELLVRVADVRFKAAGGLVVPEADRAVVRGGEDVFGVG